MSSSDKTRQKLIQSMRKTKAGAGKKPPAAKSEAKASAKTAAKATPKAATKPTPKTAAKPAPRPPVEKRRPVAAQIKSGPNRQNVSDPYQSRQSRLWPD